MSDAIVIVDAVATAYSQNGKGPDVMLLHGWADSRKTFINLAKTLSTDYRVTTVDLPGFGGSEPPKIPWDLTAYAEFLKKFTNKLDITPKVIIGHSNGGAIAITALANNILTANKLVLLAPSGVRNTRKLKKTIVKVVAKTGKLATVWLPVHTRQKLQMALYGTIGSDMLVAPALKETFRLTTGQDVQADARKLKLPTLLIYGQEDRATPVSEVGKRLASCIAGSKFQTIPGAGHFVHHDATGEVEKLIQDFIK